MNLMIKGALTRFFSPGYVQDEKMYRAVLWTKISHFVKLGTQDGFAIARAILMDPLLRTGPQKGAWKKICSAFQMIQGNNPSECQRAEILRLVAGRLQALHAPSYTDLFQTDEFR